MHSRCSGGRDPRRKRETAVDSMSSWLLKVLVEMLTNSPIEKASPGFLPRNLVTNSGALNCSLVSR
jgi:hypothetical protein